MKKLLIKIGIVLASVSFLILGAYTWENIFSGVSIVSTNKVKQAQMQANNVVNQSQGTGNNIAKQNADVKKAIEKVKEESGNKQDVGVSLEVNGENLYGDYNIEGAYKVLEHGITHSMNSKNLIKEGTISIGNKMFSIVAISENSPNLNAPSYVNKNPKFLKSMITPEKFKNLFNISQNSFNIETKITPLYTLKNTGYSTIDIVQKNSKEILCSYGGILYLAKKK